jgi:cytosine/adenosine deaminase-related metal-dependent hydrolase
MSARKTDWPAKRHGGLVIRGARCALGPDEIRDCTIEISGGQIANLESASDARRNRFCNAAIDLSGFLILPGLINAHDHLEFALYPRLGDPPYGNYVEWGEDIHLKFPDVIALHHRVAKDVRLQWGGLRNLLCGVTTVSHHNPLPADFDESDFPLRVVQGYGWAHSVALGGDLCAARAATPAGAPFIVHACEGVDDFAHAELWVLDRLGLLDEAAILVHGLALDQSGVALLRERHASLIICPSSNDFLFRRVPDILFLRRIERVAIGSDSPLTAAGDLLDEIRFAIETCNVSPQQAYCMVTSLPSQILRLPDSAGSISEFGPADLIAVRDTGGSAADRFLTLSMEDVELVMIRGCVQLASDAMLQILPSAATDGLEPLLIGSTTRWLRAPVGELLRKAEEVLGKGQVCLGARAVRQAAVEISHAR